MSINNVINVILVDEKDKQIGVGEKTNTHWKGLLHRSFSIVLFSKDGKMLIQKRAEGKYHSGGLWTNTCCSHPKPGEDTRQAAVNRLFEEMGIICHNLKEVGHFIYRAKIGSLTEYEYDHLFIGYTDQEPKMNLREASEFAWVSVKDVKKDIKEHPKKYTAWLPYILEYL
jgi:isopentenyl-diphosphate delta-isomerase